ncbi:carboxypeptidase B-like [Ornithodoros turicata]|uniref:carboxypeptidase B-like n=1 Tax=Ornithodoros turicata TaxID=34597 RepID=UPI003139AA91
MATTTTVHVFLLLISYVHAQEDEGPESFAGHHLFSVKIDTKQHLKTLLELRDVLELDVWNDAIKEGRTGLIRVPPESVDGLMEAMHSSGMQYNIRSDDLQRMINEEKHLLASEERYGTAKLSLQQLDVSRYHSYKTISEALVMYPREYSFVQTTSIGQTHEGEEIMAIQIARAPDKPIVLMDCGIHAREWVTIAACMYIINELLNNIKDPYVNERSAMYEWRIIPCMNPDGYEYSRTTNRFWRKNRSVQWTSNGTKCYGTDLNRNFDVSFCSAPDTPDPCKETFCGRAPFSEPETTAFRDYVTTFKDRIVFYFSIHSFGDLWLIPYGFRVDKPPDYDSLMTRAKRGVQAIWELSGEAYRIGPVSSVLYIAPGTAIDWMYVKKGVKMSFTLEISGEKSGFLLNQSSIVRTSRDLWTGILAAIG